MARRKRRTARTTTVRRPLGPRTVTLRVYVPERLRLPPVVYLRPPRQRQRRSRAIRTRFPRPIGRYVRKRVRVVLPSRPARVRPSSIVMYRDRMSVKSYVQTQRELEYEYNRKRYRERKSNRHRVYAGQLDSIRGDRQGIVSFALSRSRDPKTVSIAAAVSRAIGAS